MTGPILIVEDDDRVADLVAFKFETQGYETQVVHNGADAWSLLEERPSPPQAIILDLVMPGVDGIELLSRINDSSTLSSVPVVVLTGREDDAVVTRAFDLGAADYVTKPFSPAALVKRVERFLR